MIKQVEYRERASVEASVEVGARASIGNGEYLPIEAGRVSLYGSARSARSIIELDIVTFLTTDQYKELVIQIRASKDKSHSRELKLRLPAITPAGVFKPKRGNKYLRSYSGMLCIDVDGKDNPDVEDWSATAHRIGLHSPCVMYAGLSASGNGCFAIYRVAEPQRYTEHYTAIVADLSSLSLNVDVACRDIARLRFASYDPAPYLNTEAVPHTLPTPNVIAPRKDEKEIDITTRHLRSEQMDSECEKTVCRANLARFEGRGATALLPRIERAVIELTEKGHNIAEAYYDWWRIGCSLASAFGERGRWMYHAISAQSGKYKHAECDAQYTRCMRSHGIGIGTLLRYIKAVGIRW